MTPGGHGDVWYVNHGNDSLARIGPNHHIEEYFGTDVTGITGLQWGIDQSMWFIRGDRDEAGRITDAGRVTMRRDHALRDPEALTVGPLKEAWVLAQGGKAVVAVTAAGKVRVHRVPKSLPAIQWITAGSDGDVWVLDGPVVARMTPAGKFTTFPCHCSGPASRPFLGPDGAIWFMTGYDSYEAARVAMTGAVTRHVLAAVADTLAVTTGGDVHYITLKDTHTSGLYTLAMESGPFGGSQTIATAPPIAVTGALVGHIHLTDPHLTYGHRIAIDRHLYTYDPDVVPDVNTAAVVGDGQVWFTSSGAIIHTD
jgi:hypothetical protein